MDKRLWNEIERRADKLEEWLDAREARYHDLLSRSSEFATEAGFDSAPLYHLCEHRAEWMHGKLCLACDNSGWRKATAGERADGRALDPYAADLNPGAVVVHESAASKRARERQRLDTIIGGLERNERIRVGLEAPEDPMMRAYRIVRVGEPRFAARLRRGLELVSTLAPVEYMDAEEQALIDRAVGSRRLCLRLALLMYRILPGKIPRAPGAFARRPRAA
jgi:hypothetical protein